MREAQQAAALPALLVGGVALVAVILLALWIANRISRPIRLVRTQVGKLAQADFNEIPLPSNNDELRDLVHSMNHLARQLTAMREAIARGERLTLLGQLSGGLAHHLRNDVTGAKLAVQLHQGLCRSPDQESLAVALRELALTEEHLKRFLAAGRPQELRVEPCELARVVTDTRSLVEPSFRHQKIRLTTKLEPTTQLMADADQLRHLLMNLLLNAAHAAGPNGWVSVEVAPAGDEWIALCVRDSGGGPSPEIVDRLFKPFATDKPEGVGLGLAVASQIAEAHGGRLNFARVDGTTCFSLKLPIRRPSEHVAKADPPSFSRQPIVQAS